MLRRHSFAISYDISVMFRCTLGKAMVPVIVADEVQEVTMCRMHRSL